VNGSRTAAIVTGHSRGIGEAIATSLLERGARVLGVSRKSNDRLTSGFPAALEEVQLDLADSSAVSRWLKSDALAQFTARAETLLLVNNAGVLQPIGPPHMQELELIARAVAVNVAAAFMITAAFARATGNARERRVMHVSSGAGRKAYAGWSIYCATKAALDHHARCVALDNMPRFRISSIAPGVVDTEMQAEIRASTDERFPERPRFVGLHRDQKLPSAEKTGGRAARYLLSEEFGAEPVYDLAQFEG
jgi:NAD(P)-dependent dehydrogenase (short-subunit alcohol dehydrogenase family)